MRLRLGSRRTGRALAGTLLTAAVPALLLVGCGGNGTDRTDAPPAATTGPAAPTVPAPPSASVSTAPPTSPPASATPSRSPSPAPDETLVIVTRSGGIAGRHDSVKVNSDGAYTVLSSGRETGSGQLRPAELTELRRALDASGMERLPRVMFDRPAPDAFIYAINHADHEVAISDAEPVPALQRIVAAVPLPT
ncbi:hypothetical protein [Streptomyces sp. NBC_00872]|uniref:hypothetical protein n=1 Tax=Streptomyces sp. NBC_00872 TaxID=2903686 RepID=UPI00386EDFC9|nr:hypothetical protein OG214_12860 [Streptomyces sp. NBC_00872]